MFDHGVMINNGSTDRSLEIVRELAPHWDVIDSNLTGLDALMLDFLVQQQEHKLRGWKICLNVSEFLVGELKSEISIAEKNNIRALETTPVIMFDPTIGVELDPQIPLVDQKPYGFNDSAIYDFIMRDQKIRKLVHYLMGKRNSYKRRARLLHDHEIGGYSIGRHNWHHNSTKTNGLKILWFGYSPNTSKFQKRKLSFSKTLLSNELKLGQHHRATDKIYRKRYFFHKIFYLLFGKNNFD
jgi:hypothetical protein